MIYGLLSESLEQRDIVGQRAGACQHFLGNDMLWPAFSLALSLTTVWPWATPVHPSASCLYPGDNNPYLQISSFTG